MTSEKTIKKFRKLHKRTFGYTITPEEAEKDLNMLLGLIKLIQPDRKTSANNDTPETSDGL